MIEFDYLKEVLNEYVEIQNNQTEGEFNRNILIETPINEKYEIKWWSNIGYFHFGQDSKSSQFIIFDDLYFADTWPMVGGNLLSIRLKYMGNDVAIIPIEILEG